MKTRKLDGKTILLTGASFGIGEALARRLLHEQVSLILVARTGERLDALKNESEHLPAKVTTFICDFYQQESIQELCDYLKNTRIDFFISNAGKSLMRSFRESRFHDFQRTMAVNYLAPVQIIVSMRDQFSEAGTHIINVSTYNVLMKAPPKWSAYVASKKAMQAWYESNRAELENINITVSHLYLPLVESRMKDANEKYKNVRAMPLQRAVTIIINSMLYPAKHFKPWWHGFAQVGLFMMAPFWNGYWRMMIRRNWY
jgi:short-subunit dehydrogenase